MSRERDRLFDDFFGDVTYDVWRHGGNPDTVDRDRVYARWDDGASSEQAARREVEVQERRRADARYEQEREDEERERHAAELVEQERYEGGCDDGPF